jgi:hypothetical protein
MKTGILAARGTFVICDEIDLCDTEFYARALALLERTDTDLVVGSKAMVGSNDQRPMVRRLATRVYNGLLRAVCHYRGTDTHGLKAFKREVLLETARRCVLDRDVFASEFVIRAHREKKKVVEIPFTVREKRPPSINLIKRVPHVLKSVARLAVSVRTNENGSGPQGGSREVTTLSTRTAIWRTRRSTNPSRGARFLVTRLAVPRPQSTSAASAQARSW